MAQPAHVEIVVTPEGQKAVKSLLAEQFPAAAGLIRSVELDGASVRAKVGPVRLEARVEGDAGG